MGNASKFPSPFSSAAILPLARAGYYKYRICLCRATESCGNANNRCLFHNFLLFDFNNFGALFAVLKIIVVTTKLWMGESVGNGNGRCKHIERFSQIIQHVQGLRNAACNYDGSEGGR